MEKLVILIFSSTGTLTKDKIKNGGDMSLAQNNVQITQNMPKSLESGLKN